MRSNRASPIGGALSEAADERRQTLIDASRISLRWIGYIIPSIVVPLVLGYTIRSKNGEPALSSYEQMVIGALLFIIITLASITHNLSVVARSSEDRGRTARIERALDSLLSNIRVSYTALLQRGEYQENLFAQMFADSITELERAIHRAAVDLSLPVDHYTYKASQITTDIIARRDRDVLRFVHYFGDDFVDTVQGQDFYRRISGMCCQGGVRLRRLCVYSDAAELATPFAERLFDYHARNHNHEHRILHLEIWGSILTDAGVREQGDMGIWGDILCYRSPKHNAGNSEGVYSIDPISIELLTRAFDRAWDYADVPALSNAGPMTVHELATGSPPPDTIRARELAVVAGRRKR